MIAVLQLAESQGRKYTIPTLFFTELLGVALGKGIEEMGIDSHIVPLSEPVRKKLEARS